MFFSPFCSVSFCLLQQKVTGLCPDVSFLRAAGVLQHLKERIPRIEARRRSCQKRGRHCILGRVETEPRGVETEPVVLFHGRRSTLDEFLGSMVRNPWYRCRWENCVVPCAAA